MGVPGVPGAAGGGGRRVRILEKQKIKMSKMAAVAAIFCILTFLIFSNEPGEGLHLSLNKKVVSGTKCLQRMQGLKSHVDTMKCGLCANSSDSYASESKHIITSINC